MFTLTKINVMWEKLLALTKKVDAIDVEIPEHDAGDAGKYLGVESSGGLDFSDPFPATNGASTGDVLGLVGENKAKGWITPFTPIDYSETEQDTGVKWIDGKEIYSIVVSGITPDGETAYSDINLAFDELIVAYGILTTANGTKYDFNKYVPIAGLISKTGIRVYQTAATYQSANYNLIVYYTKPTPTREPNDTETNKATKKKTTK